MRRTSRDEWQRHVAKWQASGLTCRRYAERASVNASTLSWWKWKLGRETQTHPEPADGAAHVSEARPGAD